MAAPPGRDQRQPMERLVRMAARLRVAGERGVAGTTLAEVCGFAGDSASDQVAREIRHLNRQGWKITNLAEEGAPARYVMSAVDNRFAVRLTTAQQAALRRAVLVADRGDLVKRLGLPDSERPAEVVAAVPTAGMDANLSRVLGAVRAGALLRFRYKGAERLVHPQAVRTLHGKWYLSAREDGGETKSFVVARMSDVTADEPGTATTESSTEHRGLHPMTWELDAPVEVTLETPGEYRHDVIRSLGVPIAEDGNRLTYRVVNREALRSRLYELGRRVVVIGPDDVRTEMVADLRERVGK